MIPQSHLHSMDENVTHTQTSALPKLTHKSTGKTLLNSQNLNMLKSVKVQLQARLGQAEISVDELFKLKKNDIVSLNRDTNAPLELILNNHVIAHGKIVVEGTHYGVQITEVLKNKETLSIK